MRPIREDDRPATILETGDLLSAVVTRGACRAGVLGGVAAGFSVVMADTHLARAVFEAELRVVERYGFSVEWKLFVLP
jgi:hypothetical protein